MEERNNDELFSALEFRGCRDVRVGFLSMCCEGGGDILDGREMMDGDETFVRRSRRNATIIL